MSKAVKMASNTDMTCSNTIRTMIRKDGTPVEVTCGTYWIGEKQLCDDCLARAELAYPQGWRGYPGDTCRHGVYVGGSGADYMCGYCEMGDDFEEAFI